jgi:hypothetical protein
MVNGPHNLPHLLVTGTSTVERFSPIRARGPSLRLPRRDRHAHGEYLIRQLDLARERASALGEERQALGIDVPAGICLQFESDPDFDLKFDSLEAVRSGIELLSVREIDGRTVAAVFVPEGKLARFLEKIEAYLTHETPKGVPRNQALIDSIAAIRAAALEAFWTDNRELFPRPEEEIWWEVWLRSGEDKERMLQTFQLQAPRVGIEVASDVIRFPDRTVVLARGSREMVERSAELLNTVAELRRAKETPEIVLAMPPAEQAEWVEDARKRVEPAPGDAPAVCLLDTGVSRRHPLIERSLSEEDMHTYHPDWGVADHCGHGTETAGLCLYGDLMDLLLSEGPVSLVHRLESAKILPPAGANDPELYGAITAESIARVEITNPNRQRAICMPVTTTDSRDRGEPSSWSAAVDQLTSGSQDEGRRLVIISAGNTASEHRHLYPDSNRTDGIHDPGQAWNALTVGAFTEKDYIDPTTYPGWRPMAPQGGLSPSSCTSYTWTSPWPIKPDLVVEGGNMALDPGTGDADYLDSLSLLTTYWRPMDRLLTITRDTSAAAAQAARMAAVLQAAYPRFWPETVRALLVHSADWPSAMLAQCEPLRSRGDKEALLKFCGFGVPNLARALWSASNSLTLVVQDALQPYDRIENQYRTRDMHVHAVPWPTGVLQDLGETPVKMRVTLSYFVEPNPGRRGWKYRHRYASHGLRFEVKTPTETVDQFRARINATARDEERGQSSESDPGDWYLGPRLRSRGSLHSDWWQGTASDLAERGYIGIYPVIGWWRERHQLRRWDRLARYSLVVTIETPEVDVDIYTPVANQVRLPVEVEA